MSPHPSSGSTSRPKLYVGTACDQCFRCKARCAGEKPVCARCRLSNSPCTYSTGSRKKRASERGDHKTSSASPCPTSTNSTPISILDLQHQNPPDRQSSHSEDPFMIFGPKNPDSAMQPPLGTNSGTAPYFQPSMGTNGLSTPCCTTQSSILALTSELLPPTPPMEVPDSHSEPAIVHQCAPDEHKDWPSLQPQSTGRPNPEFVVNTLLPSVMGSNRTTFQESLARLHAYNIDISQDTPYATLLYLQTSLANVCNYVPSVNTLDPSPSLNSPTDIFAAASAGSLPKALDYQLGPVTAMLCVHTIQLILACYVKLRKGNLEVTQANNDLLDAYITRDMQLCQSVAEKLDIWCQKLIHPSPHYQSQYKYEESAMLGVMSESLTLVSQANL